MAGGSQRLDRFIAKQLDIGRRDTRLILAQKRLRIDGVIAHSVAQRIDHFSIIELDNQVLQNKTAHYYLLNKPAGVVSATKDTQHTTAIDLLDCPNKQDLHIVGRLDYNSTGMLLLTNDSRWSERLMQPNAKVKKRYLVRLAKPISESYISAFATGMYFKYEDITTLPAELRIVSTYEAEVQLTEGRYHQIKRMFGQFDNEVLTLHRVAIGNLELETQLAAGEYRALSEREVSTIDQANHSFESSRNAT